jgi:hypothetical protein
VCVWGRMDNGVFIRCLSGNVVMICGVPPCCYASATQSPAVQRVLHKASAASGGVTRSELWGMGGVAVAEKCDHRLRQLGRVTMG